MPYRYTLYFETRVLQRRPYLKKEWCEAVLQNPLRTTRQGNNRCSHWGKVAALGDRYLRVVTLEDMVTIHTAYPDRGFRP